MSRCQDAKMPSYESQAILSESGRFDIQKGKQRDTALFLTGPGPLLSRCHAVRLEASSEVCPFWVTRKGPDRQPYKKDFQIYEVNTEDSVPG